MKARDQWSLLELNSQNRLVSPSAAGRYSVVNLLACAFVQASAMACTISAIIVIVADERPCASY